VTSGPAILSNRKEIVMQARPLFVHLALAAAVTLPAAAQPAAAPPPAAVTLIQNVRIFDGKSAQLSGPSHVLVRGNRIERVSAAPIAADRRAGAVVIDGGGRTLMPGLIDMHWHVLMVRPSPAAAIADDTGYTNLVAGVEATDTLMRGFTTVRDMGGPSFSLKRAIDEGLVVGPRVYPSGAMISVTSGHGDFRQMFELPRRMGGPPTRTEQVGGTMIADSPDEVRMRVREQLMLGASQITIANPRRAAPRTAIETSRDRQWAKSASICPLRT
jgi:imidazolonepropionase-like amidohydrolase